MGLNDEAFTNRYQDLDRHAAMGCNANEPDPCESRFQKEACVVNLNSKVIKGK